jgi:CheY-like chemotaxis protein
VHGSAVGRSIEDLHALALAQLHVLLVHADDDTGRVLVDTVTRLGHACDLVTDARTALAQAQRRAYDILIVDGNPPGTGADGGLELIRKIRALEGDVCPCVLGVLAWVCKRSCGGCAWVGGEMRLQTVTGNLVTILLSTAEDLQGQQARSPPAPGPTTGAVAPPPTAASSVAPPTAVPAPATAAAGDGSSALPAGVDGLIRKKTLTSEGLAAAVTRHMSLRRPAAS